MSKSISIKLRLEPEEKEGFQEAANIAGLNLSAWIRISLRRSARVELEQSGRKIPFIKPHERE